MVFKTRKDKSARKHGNGSWWPELKNYKSLLLFERNIEIITLDFIRANMYVHMYAQILGKAMKITEL